MGSLSQPQVKLKDDEYVDMRDNMSRDILLKTRKERPAHSTRL